MRRQSFYNTISLLILLGFLAVVFNLSAGCSKNFGQAWWEYMQTPEGAVTEAADTLSNAWNAYKMTKAALKTEAAKQDLASEWVPIFAEARDITRDWKAAVDECEASTEESSTEECSWDKVDYQKFLWTKIRPKLMAWILGEIVIEE